MYTCTWLCAGTTSKCYICILLCILYVKVLYSWKSWWELKFGGWPPNCHCKNIGGFKFGGSVRHCHMYIGKFEILADFNLAVAKTDHQTAKFNSLPNFPAIRYLVCNVCPYKWSPHLNSNYNGWDSPRCISSTSSIFLAGKFWRWSLPSRRWISLS